MNELPARFLDEAKHAIQRQSSVPAAVDDGSSPDRTIAATIRSCQPATLFRQGFIVGLA
jgi:hypothetical protein